MKSRIVLLVLVGIAAVVLLGLGIMNGELFKVNDIQIYSDTLSSEETEQIQHLADIAKGQNIFNIDTDSIIEKINASGTYVAESASVVYPSTVKITVRKRVPHAIIETDYGYILIDKDCYVISTLDNIENYNLPIFTGIRISQYAYGTSIQTKDPFQRSLMLTVLDSLYGMSTVNLINIISIADPSNMYLVSINGKKIDLCEAADVAAKLSHLAEKELQNIILDENMYKITLYKDIFVISD